MKKPSILIVITLMLTIVSCGEKNLSCNSTMAKNTVKSIWKDVEKGNKFSYSLYGIKSDEVNNFIDNYIEIKEVRTVSKNEDLKTCKCEANLVFNVPEEVQNQIVKIKKKGGLMRDAIMDTYTSENGIPIEYNLQETEDEDIYAETFPIDGLNNKIIFYSNLIKSEEKKKEQEFVFNPKNKSTDKLYRYITGTEDCIYEISFVVNNKDKVKGKSTQKCLGVETADSDDFIGYIKNGIIYGNIANKESFELEFKEDKLHFYLRSLYDSNGNTIEYEKKDPMIYDVKTS